MDFNEFSKKTVSQIDKELKRLLNEWRSETSKINKNLLPLVDKFIKANEGGKRIRGILVVLGYQLGLSFWQVRNERVQNQDSGVIRLRRIPQNDICRVAAAYEIFHTAILAHDDIMDKSLLRRGKPSLHQALGGGHQGISLAITLADAGFFLATKIISESNFPDQEKTKALKRFSETMLDTTIGQILDIEGADALEIARLKTARYTVSGPLQLGAILAGEGEKLLERLEFFGENLGIAFQIQDDILDNEISWAKGFEQAKKTAQDYLNKAGRVIPDITKDKEMSKILEQMAEYLIERNK